MSTETYENQGGIEILIVFLHVFGIVVRRLSFVHGVEIEFGIIVLDWLEVHPEGLLYAVTRDRVSALVLTANPAARKHTIGGQC